MVHIGVSEGHRNSSKLSQRLWRPACTWHQLRSPASNSARLQLVCTFMLASFSRANLTLLPCFMLILLNPPPPTHHHRHEVEMLWVLTKSLLFIVPVLSFPFSSHRLIFCLLLLHCLWVFISHLAWKGNKRLTYWRRLALLYHFVPSLPVFYFCLWQQTLSGSWVWDKPSMVLCGEIIWQPDKAWWVSSSLLLLSSHLLPSPEWARKSPVGLRVIQTHQSGCTYGKMSTLPFWHMNCMLHVRIIEGMHVWTDEIGVYPVMPAVRLLAPAHSQHPHFLIPVYISEQINDKLWSLWTWKSSHLGFRSQADAKMIKLNKQA